jgi:RimJ/RimL family protein N-acetyltransferase
VLDAVRPKLKYVVAFVVPENTPSRAVMHRLGMRDLNQGLAEALATLREKYEFTPVGKKMLAEMAALLSPEKNT